MEGGSTNGNASTFVGFGCSFLGVESTVYFSTCLSACGSAFSSKPNQTWYFLRVWVLRVVGEGTRLFADGEIAEEEEGS